MHVVMDLNFGQLLALLFGLLVLFCEIYRAAFLQQQHINLCMDHVYIDVLL